MNCTPSSARRGRRRQRRRQLAQAGACARRAALHRRDDARRVPQVHRERRGARTPLPTGYGGRAIGRGYDRDPARLKGPLRSASQGREDQGLGAGGRGELVESVYHRPVPARQGDRPDGRGYQPAGDGAGKRSDRNRRGAAPPDAVGIGRPATVRRDRRARRKIGSKTSKPR